MIFEAYLKQKLPSDSDPSKFFGLYPNGQGAYNGTMKKYVPPLEFYSWDNLKIAIEFYNKNYCPKFLQYDNVEAKFIALTAFLTQMEYESNYYTACKENVSWSGWNADENNKPSSVLSPGVAPKIKLYLFTSNNITVSNDQYGQCMNGWNDPVEGLNWNCSSVVGASYRTEDTISSCDDNGTWKCRCNGLDAPTKGCKSFGVPIEDPKNCWYGRGPTQITWPIELRYYASFHFSSYR